MQEPIIGMAMVMAIVMAITDTAITTKNIKRRAFWAGCLREPDLNLLNCTIILKKIIRLFLFPFLLMTTANLNAVATELSACFYSGLFSFRGNSVQEQINNQSRFNPYVRNCGPSFFGAIQIKPTPPTISQWASMQDIKLCQVY